MSDHNHLHETCTGWQQGTSNRKNVESCVGKKDGTQQMHVNMSWKGQKDTVERADVKHVSADEPELVEDYFRNKPELWRLLPKQIVCEMEKWKKESAFVMIAKEMLDSSKEDDATKPHDCALEHTELRSHGNEESDKGCCREGFDMHGVKCQHCSIEFVSNKKHEKKNCARCPTTIWSMVPCSNRAKGCKCTLCVTSHTKMAVSVGENKRSSRSGKKQKLTNKN